MFSEVYRCLWGSLIPVVLVLVSVLTDLIQAGGTEERVSGNGVGCFLCNSFNGSDPGCRDPFHPAYSTYEKECKQGKRDRVGLFVAHYCIKMSGISVKTGLELVVRTCALESMAHQCGQFEFEDEKYEGCLSTCDLDGCNAGEQIHSRPTIYLLISFIVTVAHLRPVLTTLV